MSAPTTSFVGAGRPRAGSAEFNVIVLEDLLADPPTPEERTERRSELKWFDAEIKPFLYRLVRYELKLPGGLSAWRDYWICPRANFKIDLRSGIVYRLSDGRRVGYYFTLFMYCRDYTRFSFPAAKRELRSWILKQKAENPEPEERLFTEDVEKLDWIFFYVMVLSGFLYRGGAGTARELWRAFAAINGPIRTRRLFDFSTHHQLLRYFRYRAENPGPLFSVRKVSGPRKKEEIWEVRDRLADYHPHRADSRAAFAPYADAYTRIHHEHGYGSPADDLSEAEICVVAELIADGKISVNFETGEVIELVPDPATTAGGISLVPLPLPFQTQN